MTQPTHRGGADPVLAPAGPPAPLEVDHHLRLDVVHPHAPVPLTLDQLEARLFAARVAGVPGDAVVSHERGPFTTLFLSWTAPAPRGLRARLRARRG